MRSTPASTPHGRGVWAISTSLLTCALLAMTVPNLGRYPPISGDDSWVMSASYKLATSGMFGSDLYAGYYEAERHYFIALPVYHLLQAASFFLFGASVTTARAVTVASAVVVLWAATWLALRWYGTATAIISGIFLVLLRVNLIGLWPGLPLVAVGRTGRYDMTGVAFFWLTIVLLDRMVEGPQRRFAALGCGIVAGLATLTQFFGAFAIPVIAVVLAWTVTDCATVLRSATRIAAGFAVVVVPYALYALTHWPAFRGQSGLKSGRTDFLDPGFYLDNLRDEPSRYTALIDPDRILGNGVATWLFVLLAAPVAGWLILRTRRDNNFGDRMLLTILAVSIGGLALFDSTNAALYTIVFWPACCIALAATISAGAARLASPKPASRRGRVGTVALVAVMAALIAAPIVFDSATAYRDDRQRRAEVTDYTELAEAIDALIPAEAGVIGHERWWWGLHERDYRALNVLQLDWERQSRQEGPQPSFTDLFDETGAAALVIDDNARSEIGRYPAPLRQQIEAFLANGAQLARIITDPTYGRLEIYLRMKQETERRTAGEVARPVRLW